MLIFCIWVGNHKSSKLIQSLQEVSNLVREFWPQNSFSQSDYLTLLQKIFPGRLDLLTSYFGKIRELLILGRKSPEWPQNEVILSF